MSWFYPIAFLFSFSMRSPNVLPNPIDYEIAFGFKKQGLAMNKQWERENGLLFTQERYNYNYNRGKLAISEVYLYDGGSGLNYNKVSSSLNIGGVLVGCGLYHIKNIPSYRLVVGYNYNKRFNILIANGETAINMEANTDFQDYGYSISSDISFGLLRNLDLIFNIKAEKLNEIQFFNGKIGISVNLLEDKNG